MVIRRASDSTTTTIGFDGSGNIDGGSYYIVLHGYDLHGIASGKTKAGNGNDATAASTGVEPTIYTGGAL